MIRDLRKKFILVNMLLVFMVLFAVFSALALANIRRAKGETVLTLQMTLNARPMARVYPAFEIGQAGPPMEFFRAPAFLAVVDEMGQIQVIHSEDVLISEDIIDEIVEIAMADDISGGTLKNFNLRYIKAVEQGQTKIAFIDLSIERETIAHAILLAIILGGLSMGAFFIISLFLSRWALRPVEQAWDQQRRFVSDASHELKTPLTVILANTGILKSNENDTIGNQMKWVDNTAAEAARMKELVDNLLFLAKNDDMEHKVVYEMVDLSDVILTIALSMESVAFERGIALDTAQIKQDMVVLGDREQLKRLAAILIDNAIKYSDENQEVFIAVTRENNKAVFSVTNQGMGLSQDTIHHIFDRFYRADESRSKEGYGLGLSIAKSIATKHKGNIMAVSENGKTTLKVFLPLEV